jgi:HPt (histidine-containing phosphotransfer) domain-containing protein
MTNEEKILALREIEGLDVDFGLKTIMNMVPSYFKVLGIFERNEITDKLKFDEFLKEESLENFRILVHGYKSALGNIGGKPLSDKALELEKAAVSNDMDFINNNLDSFKEEVAEFAEKIRNIIYAD